MRLVSVDGASVELLPRDYQFPDLPGTGEQDWDANWLVVRGVVRLADGRGWEFTDPCLTTWEARELGAWLRGVVAGAVEPTDLGGDGERLLAFVEPNLALSLAARADGSALVRVHLSLEARPPWLRADAGLDDVFVLLDLPLQALSAAVDDWDRELARLPVRGA